MVGRGILCGHNVVVSTDNPWKSVEGHHYFCDPCQAVRKVQLIKFDPVTVFVAALEKSKDAQYPVPEEPCNECGSSCKCCCICNF